MLWVQLFQEHLVLSGFNNYIAWGETNGEDDVSDFYQIEIDPKNKNNYIYDGKSTPFYNQRGKNHN